jgi:hypothetical protein
MDPAVAPAVLFLTHGSPMFAIQPGAAGAALTALTRGLTRPRAVLVISPHWETELPTVSTASQLETIHEFGGFDPALNPIQYPAQGWAAARVTCSTKSVRVRQRPRRRDRSSPDAQEKPVGSRSDGGWWSWQETESTPSLATLADRVYQVHIVD